MTQHDPAPHRDEIDARQLLHQHNPGQLAVMVLHLRDELDQAEQTRANDHAVVHVAFEFHRHRDLMNSAVHMASVRYSPITVALAEVLGVADELEPEPTAAEQDRHDFESRVAL